MLVNDYRRTDLRTNVLESPFWISSLPVTGVGVEALGVSATKTSTGIAAVSSTTDTLTIASGFTAAGFTIATDPIVIEGFSGDAHNNDFYTLSAVSDTTLTIVETNVVSDASGESVTIKTPRGNVLFSFPVASRIYLIHDFAVEILAAFSSSAKIVVGTGTMATDLISTGGLMLSTDFDAFSKCTVATGSVVQDVDPDAAVGTVSSSKVSAWGLLGVTRAYTAPRFITGAATTVPVVYALVSDSAAMTIGSFRVHMLISLLPGIN